MTRISTYEYDIKKLEDSLTKILKSNRLPDDTKEKLRKIYQDKIDDFKRKIRIELMNQP